MVIELNVAIFTFLFIGAVAGISAMLSVILLSHEVDKMRKIVNKIIADI